MGKPCRNIAGNKKCINMGFRVTGLKRFKTWINDKFCEYSN